MSVQCFVHTQHMLLGLPGRERLHDTCSGPFAPSTQGVPIWDLSSATSKSECEQLAPVLAYLAAEAIPVNDPHSRHQFALLHWSKLRLSILSNCVETCLRSMKVANYRIGVVIERLSSLSSAMVQLSSIKMKSIWWPRTVFIALFLTSTLFPGVLQPALSSLYSWLYRSSFYQLSSFETIETVFFYVLIESHFVHKFAHHPELRLDNRFPKEDMRSSKPRRPKMLRPQHRISEIITYISPLLLMDLTMIKKFAGVPVASIRESGNYPPYPSLPANDTSISPSFLLPTLHNFTTNSPLQTRRALPPAPPTSRQLCLELTFAFVLYDGLFFLLHLALHRVSFLKSIHLAHHTHAEIHPQITNRLSIPERLSLVLLANFSLNIIGSHVLTRTAFVPVFVWLLVEIHSGLELEWGYEKILPVGGMGAREHAVHHRYGERGEGAYAPFFTWNDAALRWVEKRIGYSRAKTE